jgi:hypothetical protein
MDCGWQNSEEAANNHLERLKFLASNPDYIGRAAPPQTSGMRDFLCPSFAMMISLQPTSDVALITDYNAVFPAHLNRAPPILLRTSTASLAIHPDENAWSQVKFTAAGMSWRLGAQTLEYLTTHILTLLSDSTPGLPWALSLGVQISWNEIKGIALFLGHCEGVDCRLPLRQNFRQWSSMLNTRTFLCRVPRCEPSLLRPRPKVNIPVSGVIPIFFSLHRHCSAPAYGWPGMDLLPLPRKFIAASNRPER